jgi:hypothetical protein
LLKASAPYQLKHYQNTLAFEFSSSDFTDQQTARYRYRLQGFDSNWEETSYPFIRYTHLPSGRQPPIADSQEYRSSNRTAVGMAFSNLATLVGHLVDVPHLSVDSLHYRL